MFLHGGCDREALRADIKKMLFVVSRAVLAGALGLLAGSLLKGNLLGAVLVNSAELRKSHAEQSPDQGWRAVRHIIQMSKNMICRGMWHRLQGLTIARNRRCRQITLESSQGQ